MILRKVIKFKCQLRRMSEKIWDEFGSFEENSGRNIKSLGI